MTLSVAGALFAGIFAVRLLVENPAEPVMFLLAVPIALVGFELGMGAGMLAGALGLGLFAAWNELGENELGAFDYAVRAATFVVVGGGIGRMSEHRREAVAAVERSNASLRHANEDLDQFASMAAHDLRAPLSVVAGFGALLRDRYADRLDAQGVEFLGYIADGVDEMQELIDGMLQIARSGAAGLEVTDVDAGELVDDVVASFDDELAGRDVRVEVEQLPVVRADPRRLRQVFVNLLSNALKFADDPALVEIRAERNGRAWKFEVQDNGVGVPPEHAERIFDPLHRVDSGRSGVGIGLAVCRRIVEAHGGDIGVRPAPEAGSVFSFTLPDEPSLAP